MNDTRPEELTRLLALLQGASKDPASTELMELRARIRMMSSKQMPPDDQLRLVMDSEDLAQDALLALVRGVHEFRGNTWSAFFAFSRSLIERQKIDLRRHHGRLKRNLEQATEPARAEDAKLNTDTPSFLVSGKEDRQKLLALLDQLPEPKQQALRLRLQSMDYVSIAKSLGMTQSNARKTVSRAIQMLRDLW